VPGRLKRTWVPAPASEAASQIRPPWASTIALAMANPSPVRAVLAGDARRALDERLEDVLPDVGVDAGAAVGHLDFDRGARSALRAHDHAAVGWGMADRVLEQVEQDALQLLGISGGGGQALAQLGAHIDPVGAGVQAHCLDGFEHEGRQVAGAASSTS